MKTLLIVSVLIIAGSASTLAQKEEIIPEKSRVEWTGKKMGRPHKGEVQIKSGYLEFNNDQIVGGEVIMDMTTLSNTDIADAGSNQRLVGHLKSDDFFGVENFPVSSFVVTKATKFEEGKASISGKITIKGKTEDLSFDAVKNGDAYSARIEIDRSKFEVRYGSGSFFDNLGDNVIDDIFVLDVSLTL